MKHPVHFFFIFYFFSCCFKIVDQQSMSHSIIKNNSFWISTQLHICRIILCLYTNCFCVLLFGVIQSYIPLNIIEWTEKKYKLYSKFNFFIYTPQLVLPTFWQHYPDSCRELLFVLCTKEKINEWNMYIWTNLS